jgi:hypothetical protein
MAVCFSINKPVLKLGCSLIKIKIIADSDKLSAMARRQITKEKDETDKRESVQVIITTNFCFDLTLPDMPNTTHIIGSLNRLRFCVKKSWCEFRRLEIRRKICRASIRECLHLH